MTNTYLIRRGIVAEMIENPDTKEWGIGSYEPLDGFMKRNAAPNMVFQASAPLRYVDITDKRAIAVVEDAPRYRIINTKTTSISYPIPWCCTVHRYTKVNKVWTLESMYIGIRSTPLQNVNEDVMYALPLDNIFEDKRVCFGDTSFDTSSDLGAMLCRPINTFWNSIFTKEAQPLNSAKFATVANWRKMKLDTVCSQEFKHPTKIANLIQG